MFLISCISDPQEREGAWHNATELAAFKESKPCSFEMILKFINLFFHFYLYIYPPDSRESDGVAIHRVSNYPDLLSEMPRYCCPLVI